MKNFFNDLFELISFVQIPRSNKRIVFYSEGRDTWIHLEGIIEELLKITNLDVCYISSEKKDPGLNLKKTNFKTFTIRPGHLLNWLFANIETDVMIMTTPDLGNFQLKCSKHHVHYIYLQHSLVSLHMAYRDGAFDHYQTIFCAGPHHINEIKAIEQIKGLKYENLVEHGYSKLDQILKSDKSFKAKSSSSSKHVLIAPSWGKNGIVETIGFEIIDILLKDKFKVTLRPHPQTIKLSKDKVDNILAKHSGNPLFSLDTEMSSQTSLKESDLMISDWSGAALDYAFGLNKPVLFIDVPRKINNFDYLKIKIQPLEVKVRSEIGEILSLENLTYISAKIDNLLKNYDIKRQNTVKEQMVFNIGSADKIGAGKLQEIINGIVEK